MSDDGLKDQPDQRKHPRRLVLIPAYVGAGEDSGKSFGLVRNISLEGAYFLTQQQLEQGDSWSSVFICPAIRPVPYGRSWPRWFASRSWTQTPRICGSSAWAFVSARR